MIKVALFSHTAHFAGAEKMLFSLAKLLKESGGYYPIVWLPENSHISSFRTECEAAEIEVFDIPALVWYTYVSESNYESICSETSNQTKWVTRALQSQDIGLVLCNTLVSMVPLLAARKVGIPSVLWVHGILDSFLIPEGDLQARLLMDRLTMYLSDQIVCCSQWTQNYYHSLSTAPICTINNWSYPPEEHGQSSVSGKFVCLNTYNYYKGLMTLLEAAVLLKKKGYQFSIDLYGSGEEEGKLRTFVEQERLNKYVNFCGRTNAVGEIYQACFCLIQPSYMESFGLTVTEAMSYARPVLSTRCGGPESIVVDGETGFLVPVKAAEAMADKMMYLLDHPKEAEAMGLAGQKRYQDFFSPARAKQEFSQVFDSILSMPRVKTALDVLLEDTLMELLGKRAGGNSFLYAGGQKKHSRSLGEVPLSFTGGICKARRYAVTCPVDAFQELGICFSSMGKAAGCVEVTLACDGKDIGSISMDLSRYVHDNWTYLKFPKRIETLGGKRLALTLSFVYEANSSTVGVFEDATRRTFWFKVFNKLGHPIPGKDVLFVDFR